MTTISAVPTTGERIVALITTLVLARHGKAPKTSPDQKDEDRTLNELGLGQARKLGAEIEGMTFDTVLSSPLTRAHDTLVIATQEKFPIVTISELTCPTDGEHPVDVMFNKLGYAPLSAYFDHELGSHLKAWGWNALQKVLDTIDGKPKQVVLIGGHAILQNALAWALINEFTFSGDSNSALDLVMSTNLSEGEAFALTLIGEGRDMVVDVRHIKQD